jgi:hypothetical protein
MKQTAEQKLAEEQEANNLLGHLPSASISAIAGVISKNWKNVYFGAEPYLDAMRSMDKITGNFMSDPGTHVVNYFLSNAQTWRGPVAKVVKAELNRRVKQATGR